VVNNADVYVSLQQGMSCERATKAWDVSKCDISAVQPEFGLEIVEVHFPIPDGQAPDDSKRFKYLISWLCTQLQAGKKIHVGCIGGHGRTGTVLVALVAELGVEKGAIQYVRKHYCHKAVESESQITFLQKHYGILPVEARYSTAPTYIKDSSGDWSCESIYPPAYGPELSLYRQHLGQLRKEGAGYVACCPFHDDRHPSLRIDNKKGLWLWYCDVCGTGGNVSQLRQQMPAKQSPQCPADCTDANVDKGRDLLGEAAAIYNYQNADGNLAFQVLRFEHSAKGGNRRKTFRQRRPDGNGGWHSNVPPEVRTIYNLPAVLKADTVLVCEGEKDCDTAISKGLVATCNPMGAGKWEDRYSESLRNKDVVIIPDADDPGEKHGMQVFASLRTRARSVRIVRLPFGKDLTEWVEQGRTAEALQNLIDTTSAEDLTVAVAQEPDHSTFAKTDSGNAERFAAEHGQSSKYCHVNRKWYLWDEVRWAKDETGEVFQLAKQTVRGIPTEALKLADDEQRRALIKHALQSESESRINAMLSLGQNETGIPIRLTELDRDPMLLNVRNGTIDLRTRQLREHQREDLLTKLAPVVYEANAECPLWLQFLGDITAANIELVAYLQRAVGYTLTGEADEHALFLLYGTGANGKTTFLEVLRHILGDYAQSADFGTFITSQRSSGPRNDLAKLHGARLVTATESEDGMRLAESVVKQITGGDTVTARFLYSEHFEFKPQFKVWLGTNHKPDIRGTDEGIWRRIRLVPFTVCIPNEKRDRKLGEKLKAESAGILKWALEGLVQYHEHLLQEPNCVSKACAEYREDQDVLRQFVASCCVTIADAKVPARALYTAYRTWASEAGEPTINERQFSKALAEHGFNKVRHAAGTVWRGIGLIENGVSIGEEKACQPKGSTPVYGV
jgi:putative DNA primase/helicase